MDFVTGLLVLINGKSKSNNFILVIVNWLTKIIYYKPVKVIINILALGKIFVNIIIWH